MTEDEKQAAIDARNFMQSPVAQRVLADVQRQYRIELEESKYHERDLREDVYRQLKALRDFTKRLKYLAESGRFESVRRADTNGGAGSAA